jgi:hypothetical protein
MTDTDIREALSRATGELSAPDDLLERVRAGGHRRVVRRRSLLAAGLATVVAGSTAGVLLRREGGSAPLLSGDTRGDLARDREYLAEVRRVWHQRVDPVEDLVGEPHIVWAGTTPAGRVAMVTQGVQGDDVVYGTQGFVEPSANGPFIDELMALQSDTDPLTAILVGEQDRSVLVVVDTGRDLSFSPGLEIDRDGKVVRGFRPLTYADGAAVLEVGRQRDRVRIGLRASDGRAVELMNFPAWAYRDHPGEGQPGARQVVLAVPGWERGWPAGEGARRDAWAAWGAESRKPFYDLNGYHRSTAAPDWFVWGSTPGGVRFRLETHHLDEEPARLLLTTGRPDSDGRTQPAGTLDPDATLPVQVRLPGGYGFVIAAVGATLRYRLGDGGGWVPVAGDSALVPAAVTQVEVTRDGRPPKIVRLPA